MQDQVTFKMIKKKLNILSKINHHTCILGIIWHLPNIFVSTVGNKVKGWEVAVYRQQVQAQQHHQDLDDDPHEGGAGTQSKNLWAEPSHKDDSQSLIWLIWYEHIYSESWVNKLN